MTEAIAQRYHCLPTEVTPGVMRAVMYHMAIYDAAHPSPLAKPKADEDEEE